MTGNYKILAASAVIAAGVLLGATSMRAQHALRVQPKPDDRGAMSFMMMTDSPWLGVELSDVTADQVRDLKLGGEYGAFVKQVEQDSPAAKAGLEAGDVIVQFAGEKVRSVAELRRLVSETPAGRNVEIQVRRGGADKTLNATLEVRNEGPGPLIGKLQDQVWPRMNVPVYDFAFNFGGPRLGVAVASLTPQLGAYFGVKDGKGVLVREVSSGSAADKAGLKAGDCITKIDSTPIESANELHRALLRKQGESREGSDVTLTIIRDRKEQALKVHLEPTRQPGREASDSDMADLIDAESIAAQARDLAPYAEDMAREGEALSKQFESERGDLEKYAAAARGQAEEAQKQARELQKQRLNQSGEWQQELKQLEPQMKKFQQQMKELKWSIGSDVV
jgi:membrane-associated protease RseP (regulator of RpoE activity)